MQFDKYAGIKNTRANRNLRNAIVKLICESVNASDVQVQAVVKEASVARSSFYRTFCDIYDLENYVYYYDIQHYSKAASSYSLVMEGIVASLEVLKNNVGYYKKLCKLTDSNAFPSFHKEYWYSMQKNIILGHYRENVLPVKLDVSLRMSISGISSVILTWLSEDCAKLSIDELAELIYNHFPDDVRNLIEKANGSND